MRHPKSCRTKKMKSDSMVVRELKRVLAPFVDSSRCFLLAVSGGSDSMALLRATELLLSEAEKARHCVTVLHVDHGLREESAVDAAFVKAEAEACGFVFRLRRVDPKRERREGESVETAARRWRYDFFSACAQECGARGEADKPVLLLAHHREDQTESRLLHLFRGAGPAGLIGMNECEAREDYVLLRPFLTLDKEALRRFLPERGWREDATNGDTAYTRNALRHDILPRIRQSVNPAVDDALERHAQIVRTDEDYLESVAHAAYERLKIDGRAGIAHPAEEDGVSTLHRNALALQSIAIPREAFCSLHPAISRRVLRAWAREVADVALSFEETTRLSGCFSLPVGKKFVHYGIMGLIDFAGVHLLSAQRMQARFHKPFVPISLRVDAAQGSVGTEIGAFSFTRKDHVSPEEIEAMKRESPLLGRAYIHAAACPLVIRTGQSGERFQRFGGGSKPLRKCWNEWHVPATLRPYWPLLCTDEGEILWVVGCARSALYPVRVGEAMVVATWRWK